MNEKETPLASEMYEDLKRANRFKEKLIYILLAVFNLRVKANSRVEISMKLNMSESTVDRRLKNIKRKIYKIM